MKTMLNKTLLLLTALLLSACASGPQYPTEGINLSLTPKQAVAEATSQTGKDVLWGGMIVNSTNLESRTRLEVLAYPLDSDQRPQVNEQPYGRFLLFKQGYLETVDYAAGRRITVLGRLTGTQTGKLDETTYTYPVVDAKQLYLWSKSDVKSEPRLQVGIGVMFGR
jgi:outer membrane lipoprotein